MNIYTIEMDYKYEGSCIHSAVTSYEEAIEAKDKALASNDSFDSITVRQWSNGEQDWNESFYR